MFGSRLKSLRKDHDYTLEQLAELLDTTKQQIWRWESSKHIPGGETLENIARLFGVTTDYLLGREDNPHYRFVESDLSPLEAKLIETIRSGNILKAYKILGVFDQDDAEELKEIISASQQPEIKK